jgi:hypothetical protein
LIVQRMLSGLAYEHAAIGVYVHWFYYKTMPAGILI